MLVGLTVSVAAGALRVSATVTVLVIPPPVIVMVPLLVPTVAVVESTLTNTVPLLDPVAGLTVSQLMASLTFQDTFEVIETDCAVGFAAPCVAVNDKLDELTVRVGVGALRLSVTLTVRVRPPPVTVMVPVLVPTVAVAVSTLMVSVLLFEPLPGLTVSQLKVSVTVQATLDVIETDCAAGFAAPCVAVNDKLDEPRVNVGEGALTVNETGIDCGELVAPVPETVIDVVYVPAESPVTLAVTAREPAPVPDAGDTDSHGTGLEAPQVNVPVPVLVMLTV